MFQISRSTISPYAMSLQKYDILSKQAASNGSGVNGLNNKESANHKFCWLLLVSVKTVVGKWAM
jgi:hypothetical protein